MATMVELQETLTTRFIRPPDGLSAQGMLLTMHKHTPATQGFVRANKLLHADGENGAVKVCSAGFVVRLKSHQTFWTCDNKPFLLALISVPPYLDSFVVPTKTKEGHVTKGDLSMTVWHVTIVVFGGTDVVLRAIVVTLCMHAADYGAGTKRMTLGGHCWLLNGSQSGFSALRDSTSQRATLDDVMSMRPRSDSPAASASVREFEADSSSPSASAVYKSSSTHCTSFSSLKRGSAGSVSAPLCKKEQDEHCQSPTAVNVPDQTIRNRPHEGDLRARHPVVGPVLTSQHRRARLAFATEHQNWQIRHRCLVLFTDESRFYLSTCDRRDRLWRRRGECYAACNIIPHDWFGGGHRDKILGPVVRPYAAAVVPGFLLVHNNARPPVAGVCRQFLENEGIDSIDWPPGSPDLNPIEPLWDIMFRAIRRHQVALQAVQELSDALVQIWEEIPQDTIRRLIRSTSSLGGAPERSPSPALRKKKKKKKQEERRMKQEEEKRKKQQMKKKRKEKNEKKKKKKKKEKEKKEKKEKEKKRRRIRQSGGRKEKDGEDVGKEEDQQMKKIKNKKM
ncbi:hypothetical protein NFI96_001116 [Prochilodus magdalenae]|nr:hypothetical protein NFI96_001116 [Prochilodus magdalenae]